MSNEIIAEGINKESTNVLVKSEKISQKKKKQVIWLITALVVALTTIYFVVDYGTYRKGQKFGLVSMAITSENAGVNLVDKDDSYAEQCKAVYRKLNERTSDVKIDGVTVIDASRVRDSEDALRKSFSDIMVTGGFKRYSGYFAYDCFNFNDNSAAKWLFYTNHYHWEKSSIATWFEYTNFIQYYFGCFRHNIFSSLCNIIIILSIVFTVLINREEKKELLVYTDSVLCKFGPKKSKQMVFKDINSVDFGKNSLKLEGNGFRFRIANITNAEKIKAIVIEKKSSAQSKPNELGVSGVDELKKYKDLLDAGVITQEEFNTKKKQILGL